jgi:hypothetical protein
MSKMNYGGETKGTGSVPDVGPWANDADDNKGLDAIAKTQAKRGKPKTVSEEGREASRPLWNLVDEFAQLPGLERRRLYGVYSKRLAALHEQVKSD